MSARDRAHRDALRASVPDAAGRLQTVLGQRITAYAIGVRDPKTIGRYARGDQTPRDGVQQRLRHIYEITQVLLTRESPETVRAWMVGANPNLEDRAPIDLLHEDDYDPVRRTAAADTATGYRAVVDAAEDFIQAT